MSVLPSLPKLSAPILMVLFSAVVNMAGVAAVSTVPCPRRPTLIVGLPLTVTLLLVATPAVRSIELAKPVASPSIARLRVPPFKKIGRWFSGPALLPFKLPPVTLDPFTVRVPMSIKTLPVNVLMMEPPPTAEPNEPPMTAMPLFAPMVPDLVSEVVLPPAGLSAMTELMFSAPVVPQ